MPKEHLPQDCDTEEILEEDNWSTQKSVAVITGSIVLAGAVIAGAVISSEHEPVEGPYGQASLRSDRKLPDYLTESCPEIPETTIKKAKQLLQKPENPIVTKIVSQGSRNDVLGGYALSGNSVNLADLMADKQRIWEKPDIHQQIRNAAADRLGLTVFDTTVFRREASERKLLGTETKLNKMHDHAAQFLKQYGLQIKIADKTVEQEGMGAVGRSIVDVMAAKQKLYEIVLGIAKLPREYVALSGVRTITLVSGFDAKNSDSRFNSTLAKMSGTDMWIDIHSSDNEEYDTDHILHHELGHGVMYALCGGPTTQENQQFLRSMEGLSYDPKFEGNSYEDYTSGMLKLETQTPKDARWKAALHEVQRTAIEEIATVSDYARADVQEDRAETVDALTNNGVYQLRHAAYIPRLHDKMGVTLGRLLYYRPALAIYFMQTALKPEKTTSPVDTFLTSRS